MPTFEMTFKILFGTTQFAVSQLKGITKVKINSSVDSLADTATIEFPATIENVPYDVTKKLKRGFVVRIELGYNGQNNLEFLGYVRSISANNPCVIECEDGMYLFRKEIKGKVFLKSTVATILQYVCSQIGVFTLKENLGGLKYDKFVIQNGATGFEVLQKIKEQYGISIYVKDGNLVANLKYIERNGTVNYDFRRSVKESNLKWVEEQDVKVEVRVRGVGADNKQTETVSVGSKGGEVRKLPNKINVTDKATLEKVAREELKRLTYKGFRGDLTTWGIPFCDIGYSARIIDADYPDHEGTYFVKAVETGFSKNGFERKITLGEKL